MVKPRTVVLVGECRHFVFCDIFRTSHLSYSPISAKGGYIGDYVMNYYRGY